VKTEKFDVIIIGSGPGGLAAAIAAKKNGAKSVLVIERDIELGGILLQCIHNGFGMEIFKEDLPGPTYAQRFIDEAAGLGIEAMLDTMAIDVSADRHLTVTSKQNGLLDSRSRPERSFLPWAAVSARERRSACPVHALQVSIQQAPLSAGLMWRGLCPVRILSSWVPATSA